MPDTTWTAADLARLESMYAQGIVESETADGKRVRFASLSALWTAIQRVKRVVRGTRRARVGYFSPDSD